MIQCNLQVQLKNKEANRTDKIQKNQRRGNIWIFKDGEDFPGHPEKLSWGGADV